MKATGKVLITAVLSIFFITLTAESEARRGNSRGPGHISRPGQFKGGQKRNFRGGHYKQSTKQRYRHSPYGYGAKHRYGYKRHHYRSKHYGPKRSYRRGYYRGYGYYGNYGYYRYPYGYRYYYRPYPASLYYYNAYQDDYRDSSDDASSDGSIDYQEDYARGWNLLREDRAAEALQAFGYYAQANPSEGMPKVGYALALAELGRLEKGIRAMRRALQENPEALPYVAIDEKLRPKVERTKGRYEQADRFFENDPGGSFMLAALYYLLDDLDAAQKAMERNIDSSDTSTSAKNLKRLIEEETQTKVQ
jgi:hypothetical protein